MIDPRLMARLQEAEVLLKETETRLSDPSILSDQSQLVELGRRHSELKNLVDLASHWRTAVSERDDALELAEQDPELAEELRRMASERGAEAETLERLLKSALIPRDPRDRKNVILEIRPAAGGDEAAMWAGDLLRMYRSWAERSGFELEVLDSTESDTGGFSRVTALVKGDGAYSRFKFEAGVHRVQRVPRTESQGRIHTSTATVAVLVEAEEFDVVINPDEIRVDVFRSTGPGGQSVNTTDSAVRITHIPTGLVVSCQNQKSQLQNKERALQVLRSRLLETEEAKRHSEEAGERRSQVGTGERSEKIRTYNFKEGRVTDHRIEKTLFRLDSVLDGDLAEFVDALALEEESSRLMDID